MLIKNSFTVKLAGVTAEISVRDKELNQRLKSLYTSYRSKEKARFKITIQGNLKPRSDYNPGPFLGTGFRNGQHEIYQHNGSKRIVWGRIKGYKASFKLKNIIHFPYLLAFIRLCFQSFIEKEKGFILHASCGLVDNKAYIFSGPSGAGKSTALKNLRPDKPITEDCLAIRMNNGRPQAFALPHRGEINARGMPEAIIFPEKSRHIKLTRESLRQAVTKVKSNTILSYRHKNISHLVEKTISRFCDLVPAYTLRCPKNIDIRKVIHELSIC